MMNRPHAFIMKENKLRFPKSPLMHKPLKMEIPNLVFPIPLNSGHTCYLSIPSNYNHYDLEIVKETLRINFDLRMQAEDAFNKSVLGQFIHNNKKKNSIIKTHY